MRLVLPFLLLVIPVIEITLFVVVGREIGLGWTLAMVLASAIAGTTLLRIQGFAVMDRIRSETRAGRVPGRELAHGLMLFSAGLLLITPGFFTDTIGFLLFWPAIRDAIFNGLKAKLFAFVPGLMAGGTAANSPFGAGPLGGRRENGGVVDLDADEFTSRPAEPTGRRTPFE